MRRKYYSLFFDSGDQELGRQAFLQHLMRSALRQGISRRDLIWNTDSGFLAALEKLETPDRGSYPLEELVVRYRLVEPVTKVADVEIREPEKLSVLIGAEAVCVDGAAIRDSRVSLLCDGIEKSWAGAKRNDMFDGPVGRFLLFRLGEHLSREQLPEWLGSMVGPAIRKHRPLRTRSRSQLRFVLKTGGLFVHGRKVRSFMVEMSYRPLEGIGDWGFRVSRNRTLHGYPSTFVHAIPSALLHALGVGSGTVLDPFGGTGQHRS